MNRPYASTYCTIRDNTSEYASWSLRPIAATRTYTRVPLGKSVKTVETVEVTQVTQLVFSSGSVSEYS